jgi:hypothetical protein
MEQYSVNIIHSHLPPSAGEHGHAHRDIEASSVSSGALNLCGPHLIQ